MDKKLEKILEDFLRWFIEKTKDKPDLSTVYELVRSGVTADELEKLYNVREVAAILCKLPSGEYRKMLIEGRLNEVDTNPLYESCRKLLGEVIAEVHLHVTNPAVPSEADLAVLESRLKKGEGPRAFCICSKGIAETICICLKDLSLEDLSKIPCGEDYLEEYEGKFEEGIDYIVIDDVQIWSEDAAGRLEEMFLNDVKDLVEKGKVQEYSFRS